MRARVLSSAAAIAWAAVGCGGEAGGPSRLERELARAIGEATGVPIDRVRCAGPRSCVARVGDAALPVAVTDVGGELGWSIDGLVLDARALAGEVAARLAEVELVASIDCGARAQVVQPGAVVSCALADARRAGEVVATEGRALATVASDGSVALELLFGDAAIAARTVGVAPQELARASRALEAAEGATEDDDPGDGSGASTGSAALPP